MSFIKKYSYIRAILIGLPFGVLSLISGINLFGTLTKEDELIKVVSSISKIEEKKLKEGDRVYDLLELTLENGKVYYTGTYKNKVMSYFSDKDYLNRPVEIWSEKGKKYIKQLYFDEKFLIKYSPPYWIAHFFFWLGLVTLISGAIYIIKHPEDLTGEKKK